MTTTHHMMNQTIDTATLTTNTNNMDDMDKGVVILLQWASMVASILYDSADRVGRRTTNINPVYATHEHYLCTYFVVTIKCFVFLFAVTRVSKSNAYLVASCFKGRYIDKTLTLICLCTGCY